MEPIEPEDQSTPETDMDHALAAGLFLVVFTAIAFGVCAFTGLRADVFVVVYLAAMVYRLAL